MSVVGDIIARSRVVEHHRPWTRAIVDADTWEGVIDVLADGTLSLLSLWGEPGWAHAAVMAAGGGQPLVLSLACPGGRYPSVGARHPPAIRLERALFDLYGLIPDGALDRRPWLDHGRWDVRQPLGANAPADSREPYRFVTSEGESLHQIAVGPVHAGIIEPGHFRFAANGETVVRLEARLGYLHRGVVARMAGLAPQEAARFAARACGDSTVAYSTAFAHAVEAALEVAAPPRAQALRGVMAEMERLANHLGDIGAICNDAAFALMHAHCGVLREQVLRAAAAVFSHRLMMDSITPGGVAVDLGPDDLRILRDLIALVRDRFPPLVSLYDDTASLQDRTVGTGWVAPHLARQFAAGGYVGRASSRVFDARQTVPYAPYDTLGVEACVREAGDVNARVWVRIDEVDQSLTLIERLLDGLPEGPARTDLPKGSGEGLALVEGFRGDVLAWVRVMEGHVERCHLRDPSWFQWPLLEACIEGNIVADFPLCNKSFNCAYAGVDL
jgi:Ni,Fe-hydrogenase III large subunit